MSTIVYGSLLVAIGLAMYYVYIRRPSSVVPVGPPLPPNWVKMPDMSFPVIVAAKEISGEFNTFTLASQHARQSGYGAFTIGSSGFGPIGEFYSVTQTRASRGKFIKKSGTTLYVNSNL